MKPRLVLTGHCSVWSFWNNNGLWRTPYYKSGTEYADRDRFTFLIGGAIYEYEVRYPASHYKASAQNNSLTQAQD
jgi:hypothetical protein